MKFSNTLRNLIEERGLMQKQVAKDLGIPASTMGGYVQGTSEPDFDTVRLFSSYFDVSTDYLLSVKNKKAENDNEDELLRIFRSLNATQQNVYLEQGKAFIKISLKENGK